MEKKRSQGKIRIISVLTYGNMLLRTAYSITAPAKIKFGWTRLSLVDRLLLKHQSKMILSVKGKPSAFCHNYGSIFNSENIPLNESDSSFCICEIKDSFFPLLPFPTVLLPGTDPLSATPLLPRSCSEDLLPCQNQLSLVQWLQSHLCVRATGFVMAAMPSIIRKRFPLLSAFGRKA